MGNEYLKIVLKKIDGSLKGVSRNARIGALSAFEIGLNYSFNRWYPDRFEFDSKSSSGIEEIFKGFYDVGTHVGTQFGPLEVESSRKFLLAEIEKRKRKFSKTSIIQEYWDLFSKTWSK